MSDRLYHLYFAACDVKGGLYHYTLKNGALKYMDFTPMHRPMYMEANENGMDVVLQFPFEGSRESGIVTYRMEDFRLTEPSEIISTKGREGCHICRFNGNVYVANYSSGSLFSSGGALDVHEGKGPNPFRQEMPHIHYVHPSPDGKYLLSVDLGLDAVYTYDSGLNVISIAHVPAGEGPRHLAFSEDRKTVFCVNELGGSVSVFAYEDGRLSLQETVSILPSPVEGNTSGAIRVAKDYVYATNRGEETVAVLKWDGSHLKYLSSFPCCGVSPRDFLIVEDMMFITNERTNNVAIFRGCGELWEKLPEELHMPNPLCVIAVPGEA